MTRFGGGGALERYYINHWKTYINERNISK